MIILGYISVYYSKTFGLLYIRSRKLKVKPERVMLMRIFSSDMNESAALQQTNVISERKLGRCGIEGLWRIETTTDVTVFAA